LQVSQLEKDLKAAEQKYSITNEHKNAIEEQLDKMRIQKSNLENLLEKERNSKRSIQQGSFNHFVSAAIGVYFV